MTTVEQTLRHFCSLGFLHLSQTLGRYFSCLKDDITASEHKLNFNNTEKSTSSLKLVTILGLFCTAKTSDVRLTPTKGKRRAVLADCKCQKTIKDALEKHNKWEDKKSVGGKPDINKSKLSQSLKNVFYYVYTAYCYKYTFFCLIHKIL